MSVVRLDDVAVIRGTVTFPLRGAWVALLTLSGTDAPAVGQSVTLSVGSSTWVGTVVTSDSDTGRLVSCRVVAGRAGLRAQCPAQGFFAATKEVLLRSALGVGGEALSASSDSAVLSQAHPHWARPAQTVSEATNAVLGAYAWRFLPDGSVWVGEESWLPVEVSVAPEREDPAAQRAEYPIEDATIMPGTMLGGRKVREVVYSVDDTRLRASVCFGESEGGLAGVLGDIVQRQMRPVQFQALRRYTVVSQSGDVLELRAESPSDPGLSRVPIRIGGVSSITLLPGTTVLVTHEDGAADRPVVVQVYSGPVQKVATQAVESIELNAASVKAGGELSLVLHDILLAWVAQLTTAGLSIGLAVPPLVGAQTTILKGA